MLTLLRLQLAPMVQRAIGDQEIASNLRDTFAAGLHQPHRFQLKLFRKRSLFLWHRTPPFLWGSIFQLPLLHQTGASSPSSTVELGAHPVGRTIQALISLGSLIVIIPMVLQIQNTIVLQRIELEKKVSTPQIWVFGS